MYSFNTLLHRSFFKNPILFFNSPFPTPSFLLVSMVVAFFFWDKKKIAIQIVHVNLQTKHYAQSEKKHGIEWVGFN